MKLRLFALTVVTLVGLLWGARALASAPLAGAGTGRVAQFTSLYAHDPLRHSISLATGAYGTALQAYQVVNTDSEFEFGTYTRDAFSAGIQGGQVGDVLDLGSSAELALQLGYQETVGAGQGFASIHFENNKLLILASGGAPNFQIFAQGQQYLRSPAPAFSTSVPVELGHLYLTRIFDSQSGELLRFAKVMVVGFSPGQSVELLWLELALP